MSDISADVVGYYALKFIEPQPNVQGKLRLMTAAVMTCGLCGRTISGMGGGGIYLCKPCGDVVASGQAQHAIVWETKP